MTDAADWYRDVILDHDRHPRNTGRLPDATHVAEGNNPLCGDRLVLGLRLEAGRVCAARCDVQGCAICRASGSMLTEAVTGRGVDEVMALAAAFFAAVSGPAAAPTTGAPASPVSALGPLEALSEARRFPNRARCATLPWEALRRALAAERSAAPGGDEGR
jgi:nitrogen fixation protein NifU and related proteins